MLNEVESYPIFVVVLHLRHDEERIREDLDRVAALFREGVGRISGRFWEVFVL